MVAEACAAYRILNPVPCRARTNGFIGCDLAFVVFVHIAPIKFRFCSMISRRPYLIVPTVSRSALVPVASPAMCFTSGSGASSRSIFNDLFSVIRCSNRLCGPLSRLFASWLLRLHTARRLAFRYRHLATFARGLVSPPFPSRKVSVSNSTLQVNRKLTIRHKLVYKKITPGKTARNGVPSTR